MSAKKTLIKQAKNNRKQKNISSKSFKIKGEEELKLPARRLISQQLPNMITAKNTGIICLDDDQIEEGCPTKKIKQEEKLEQKQKEFITEKGNLRSNCNSAPLDPSKLKVIKLNHFFKWQGQIYFQVMTGSENKTKRQPSLMTFQELCQKQETKLMVYHYISSACKFIAAEEAQDYQQQQED